MSDRTATERIHFGTIKEAIEPPNLIEVQLNSYVDFLQKDVPPGKRKNTGCKPFSEVFPDRKLRRKGDA
jgi:DNA-directed RNA polymerase subunit beta